MKLLYHNGRKTEGKKIMKTQPHKNEKVQLNSSDSFTNSVCTSLQIYFTK